MPRARPSLLAGFCHVAAVLAAACGSSGNGELIVVVDTDALVPCDIDRITIDVAGPSGPLEHIETPLSGAGAIPLPLTLGLYQAGASDGPVHVVAKGLKGTAEVMTAEIRTRFDGERRRVDLLLLGVCAGAICDTDQTCDPAGTDGCRSIDRFPDLLPEWNGDVPRSMHRTCSTMPLGSFGTCLAPSGATVPALPGDSPVVVEGALTSGSRTVELFYLEDPYATSCPPRSSFPQTVYVEPLVVCNAGPPRTYEVRMFGSCARPRTLDDPMLVVYAGESIPADVRMCLAANDDADESLGCVDSTLRIDLETNEVVTVVATSALPVEDMGVGTYELVFEPL